MTSIGYLDTILKKVNKREPTQLILYYFDRANVNFIKTNIVKLVKQRVGGNINISESSTIDLMVEVYTAEIVHNRVMDLKTTISKMNLKVINNGVNLGHTQTALEKYRQTNDNVRLCHYPRCTKTEKKIPFGSTI
jgi:hypothetical protein